MPGYLSVRIAKGASRLLKFADRSPLLWCHRALATSNNRMNRPSTSEADKLTDIGTRTIFTEDHDMFRTSVRKFFRDEVAPQYDRWAENGQPDRDIWLRAGELGFIGVTVPEHLGGPGGDLLMSMILSEEQWYSNCTSPVLSVQSDLVLPYLEAYGSEEQKEKYMTDIMAGRTIGAIAMTEPSAGSDLQGIRTRARRVDGGDWLLTGSKLYITHGYIADVVIVVAITEPDARSPAHGISLFLVDSGTPGFSKGKKLNKLGCLAEDTAELFFDEVRLPACALLGEENKGFYYLMNMIPRERFCISWRAVAHAEMMFELTRTYLADRPAFGQRLIDIHTIQHSLAEMKTEICVARAFLDESTVAYNNTMIGDNEKSAMVKYWTTDLQRSVADRCVQLHGGYGYMKEAPISRAYLDGRIQAIWGGTNEIMKNIISKAIVAKS